LADLVEGIAGVALHGDGDVAVGDVEHDSRSVRPGALYACIPGATADGHDFAPDAVAGGAVALLAERRLDLGVPVVVVPSVRRALGPVASRCHGDPSRSLEVVGVTGTNGKTTVAHLLAEVLAEAGRHPEVIGTLTGTRTTPEAPELQRSLARARDAGVDAVVMEVSSHALDQHRVDGTTYACAVFTNLSVDHLDHHGTMEAYFEAKARLFRPELARRAVVNLDDPYGRRLAESASVPTTGFSADDADDLVLAADHARFRWRGHAVRLGLSGRFNVANALAAATAAAELGIDDAVVAAGLGRPVRVPGRMERVDAGQPFTVLVDFAHTPDGLRAVLTAARELVAPGGSVAVVFGCGGDRDPAKRPMMGEVAAHLADRTVVTADNSRSEPTSAIIDAVLSGHRRGEPREAAVVEPDRRAAIRLAVAGARAGDVVVIAGKGHEATQVVGDRVTAFDDREVARTELLALPGGPAT
jgi:UDP-N-acetylmuramoyl-L-alanyl-D-glutamate--2,6-diaminopimelate ligase